jgi:signal transduction histidine kinase
VTRPRPVRPLDPLGSIKAKLGVVVVGAVAAAVGALVVTNRLDVPLKVSAPLTALLALVMVQLLARGMTFPLREMARAAAAMAKGDYAQRVTASSRDEVGELARAFNRMAAELAETDRVRRDLIANVSHELRTPIAALQAVLENLVDEVERPEPATLRTMLRQVERLGRLAAQLLDLSRLESGVVRLERRAVALRQLIGQVVQEARLARPEASVAVEVDPPWLCVHADPERLHQVVANLVENALRFSPSGGTVAVVARAEVGEDGAPPDRTAVLEVLDEGPGIPGGEADRVFERFYRADPARSSADGGAGLGLAIVRWIVELHGGEVRAEPREPAGCRMVVTLPRVVRGGAEVSVREGTG